MDPGLVATLVLHRQVNRKPRTRSPLRQAVVVKLGQPAGLTGTEATSTNGNSLKTWSSTTGDAAAADPDDAPAGLAFSRSASAEVADQAVSASRESSGVEQDQVGPRPFHGLVVADHSSIPFIAQVVSSIWQPNVVSSYFFHAAPRTTSGRLPRAGSMASADAQRT